MATNIIDLKRNDVDAAVALYQERVAKGPVPPALVRALLMLQNDPTELLARINELEGGEPEEE